MNTYQMIRVTADVHSRAKHAQDVLSRRNDEYAKSLSDVVDLALAALESVENIETAKSDEQQPEPA